MRRDAAVEVEVDSINVTDVESTLGASARCELVETIASDPVALQEPAGYAAAISESQREGTVDWQRIDRALRTLARRRATLDADEARWLREAEACRLWRHLGMVSAIDYMERVLGYGPRVAQDRLRVARALGTLPELTAALATGELPFTAVRELTRVATAATEAAWRRAALGKTVGEIEQLVVDHRPGDNPDDPVDPEVRTRMVRFELSPETFTTLRQAHQLLNDEHGSHLSDDELIAALSAAVLDGAPATEPTGRAKHQIAVIVCERCGQGWQEGAGAKLAISAAALERASCDAQHIGSIDGSVPERAHQDVPPSVVRLVWRRDGGRCRIPGCRSTRGLEIHHLVHRADGGNHDLMNLALTCSSCHLAHHRGVLTITGTADQIAVHRRAETQAVSVTGTRVGAPVNAHADASAIPVGGARVAAPVNAHADVPTIPVGGARVGAPVAAHAEAPAIPVGGARLRAPVNAHADGPHVGAPVHAHAGVPAIPVGGARVGAPVHAHAGVPGIPVGGARVGAPVHAHAGVLGIPETGARVCARCPADEASKLDVAILRTQAKGALIGLGWKPAIAAAAVTAAAADLDAGGTLEQWIRAALRWCPRPLA